VELNSRQSGTDTRLTAQVYNRPNRNHLGCAMKRLLNCTIALACLMFGLGFTTVQERKDYRNDVLVQLEILDMTNGLPGAASKSTCLVGGSFGRDTTKEKDPSGKQTAIPLSTRLWNSWPQKINSACTRAC
jgi:hypothetical protein